MTGCEACEQPLKAGELYFETVDGGPIHDRCCDDGVEGFVDLETGEPLTVRPTPLVWLDAPEGEVSE